MNIGYIKLKHTGEYIDLEEALGQTLSGSYSIQAQGAVFLCESENKPTEGGFYYNTLKPFTFKRGSGKLWVYVESAQANINIAE